MSKSTSREFSRWFALLDRQGAVDEQVCHARRILVRIVERRRVAERLRVEHHHVGKTARLQVTTLRQAQHVGGQSRRTADRLPEGKQLVLDGVATDLAWEGAVVPWMRHGIVLRHGTAV